MNGVAVGTDDAVLRVRAAADIGAGKRLRMAAQAGVEDLLGLQAREGAGNSIRAAARLNVRLTRPVAALAAGIFGFLLAGREALVMRVAIEVGPDVDVTSAAYVAADVIRRQATRWREHAQHDHP